MSPTDLATTRRRFLAYFSSIGLSSTLLPGVLWATYAGQASQELTVSTLKSAVAIAGLEFTEEEEQEILKSVNRDLSRYDEIRNVHVEASIAPPMYFSPLVPALRLDRQRKPSRVSEPPALRRPSELEDVAFWPMWHLAHLIRTRQVKSVELTAMYLERLKKYNAKLNCVVTLTEDLAMQQARRADSEIAAGNYRGPLHGVPWGCKDIISVPGYPTTFGSDAFRNQILDTEATVVRLLREAGAVLVAKLSTGELAGGDQWFGGRTNNPWDLTEGSSGSSAGPASAVSAGLVGFAIGTDTGGSILCPSTVCGVTGLRPTFGRVSRYGAMTRSWTQDRIGPLCRTVEDCALALQVIALPDSQDLSVIDLPFNWDAELDIRRLRVGYPEAAFHENGRSEDWKQNDERVLDELKSLGIKLEPYEIPKFSTDILTLVGTVEMGASFDEFLRTGREKDLTDKNRAKGLRESRLIPAVEYLQAQRVRAVYMQQFSAVVSRFDVLVAPFVNMHLMRNGSWDPLVGTPIYDHFRVSCDSGYPATAVPNGFTTSGQPTSIMFVGGLYRESEMLALAKAYQHRAGWYKKYPTL
jgi:Asp-tRNA(Asn)/Glu-tRNA(Gln) amidotransferase A subunit family amidase